MNTPKKHVRSLLSTKHDIMHPELVKQRHRRFLRDYMEGSHVKKFCHKIERKSLNIITWYFNNSAEPPELFNNDHHPIILTNDLSQISPYLKDLWAKGPHFYQLLTVIIGLNFNLILILLPVEWELDICFEAKVLYFRMIYQYPVHPRNLHRGHQRQALPS